MAVLQVNTKLLPVKATYFCVLGGVASLLPYLAVYMMQIGLSPSETAIIYGTMPFLGAFVRALVGGIADKLQKHKATLMVCCLLSGVFHGCLLLVPSRVVGTGPEPVVNVSLHCGPDSVDTLLKHCLPRNCAATAEVNDGLEVATGFINSTDCLLSCCSVAGSLCPANDTGSSELCVTGDSAICHEFHFPSLNPRLPYGPTNCTSYTMGAYHYLGKEYSQLTCPSEAMLKCTLKCKESFDNEQIKSCNLAQRGEQPSKPAKFEKTFWMFFVFCLIGQMFFAPIFSLVDAMTYDYLGSEHGKWGKQRLWGTIGFAIFAVISGLIMDVYKGNSGTKNYTFAFVGFAVLNIVASFFVCFYKISSEFQCKQMFKNIGMLLKSLEVVMLLLVMLVFGIYTGLIETFLYWHLITLGGTQLLNGLCMLVNCIPEAFVLFLAGYIIKRIGHVNCLHIALLSYGVRLVAYSFLTNPWVVLAIEPLQAICFGLMYAAASSYASMVTPPGLSGTIQGVIGALYFGAGKGLGSVVGGIIFEKYKAQITFRSYGISAFIFLVIFFVIQFFIIRPRKAKKQAKHDAEEAAEPAKEQEMQNLNDQADQNADSAEKSTPEDAHLNPQSSEPEC